MENKGRLLFEVTLWEFSRWFKLKDQIISIIVISLISLLIFGGKAFLDSKKIKTVNLAVIHNELLPNLKLENKFVLKPETEAEKERLFKLLDEEELAGILIISSKNSAELHVNEHSEWISEIKEALNSTIQNAKLKEMNLSREQLAELFKEYDLNINSRNFNQQYTGTGEKITAGVFILLMLFGVFISLAYQLVAITGEKQLRITELVVSAITPQTWIDGKILGISLLALVTMIFYSLGSILFVLISAAFGSGWSVPILIGNPALVLLLLFLSVTGFFFWNIFFTAIAATINDPNTSARGTIMFIPIIPVSLAYFAIANPNSGFIKFLSIFPITSPTILSTRLVLTEVPALEIIFSIILLFISMWYMRKLAAKIFATSILLSGKEPEWKEIMKWLRQS